MSQILAISFDCLSSPSLILKSPQIYYDENQSYGRGFAWYSNDELSATVIKETKYIENERSTLIDNMQDFSKFNSSIFIGHIRGAAKRLVQKDTQPFSRTYAGRDWVFVHNGDLKPGFEAHIPLAKRAFFEPIGSTDSEYIFCYILEKIKKAGGRSLATTNWDLLFTWFAKINKLGTLNIILSDGLDTLIYQDAHSFNPLYWIRSTPPHEIMHFETDLFTLDISSHFDSHHTFVLVSNQSVGQHSQLLQSSQMIILRRGQIIWNNLDQQNKPIATPTAPLAHVQQPKISVIPEIDHLEKIDNQILNEPQMMDYIALAKRKTFSIVHETIYQYDEIVHISKHLFHLHPIIDHIQSVANYKLFISVPGYGEFFEDVFGNIASFYQIQSDYDKLIIRSESIVEVADNPALKSETLHQKREIPLVWLPWQRQMMSTYLLPPELPESELNELIDFAMSFVKRNDYDLMEVLNDINRTIYQDFDYVSGSTTLTTTAYQLFMSRHGVCQDFTNLFICLARLLNVPARYRTGYIYTNGNYDNKIQSQASHAWVELYLPYIGWYGFDPTNGCIAGKNHIRVACGRNYVDASPTSGTIYKGGGHEELFTEVKVSTIDDENIQK